MSDLKIKVTSLLISGLIIMSVTSCDGDGVKEAVNQKVDITETTEDIESRLSECPQELVDLYYRNPEAEDFVLSYPDECYSHNIDLSEYDDTYYMPHLLQWDKRWGYESYNNNYLAVAGCGPTCLSMVAIYLTGNSEYSPLWMAEFSDSHGYAIEGVGTAWSLFTDGVQSIDLYGYSIGTVKETIVTYLLSGYPIICSMGPGEFTDEGHFVVLNGYEDGYVDILDPNSNLRTKKWKLEDINDQMVACWAMYVGDPVVDSPDYYDNNDAIEYYEEESFEEDFFEDEYYDDEEFYSEFEEYEVD